MMRFRLILNTENTLLPINYQYPLSAAIYKILNKADSDYADFLHKTGYGKGFKLFCFSDLKGNFKLEGDRLKLLKNTVSLEIAFHLPEASQNFIKGLFMSQQIEIADKKSKAVFTVQSVEALPNPLGGKKDNEIVQVALQTASACVAGLKNESGMYEFLNPEDPQFAESLLYNWKEKIKTLYPEIDPDGLVLSTETALFEKSPKSRLMTIKAGTPAQTKIRGFMNFGLTVTGEKRFVELLMNSGAGLYNALGCGMVRHL